MIIFRYLSTQILLVMSAVTVILLAVSFTSRFLQYLADAVAGKMTTDILLLLMLSRLPEFLLIIMPLAFFLGVLLAYGRMYADNEMAVLGACGYSRGNLLAVTLSCGGLVAALVATLSLYVAPLGLQSAERLQQTQAELTELDLIVPGQFQMFGQGMRTTYAESVSSTPQGRQLNNTFVAMRDDRRGDRQTGARIMVSESARPVIDEASGRRYMLLENGFYYDGVPGQADFQVTAFEEQGLLLPETVDFAPVLRERAMPTPSLLGSTDPEQRAELQWRLSVILMIPVLALMSVPLSRVAPRQGRFSKLVPATLLYASYFLLLELVRERMASGEMGPLPGMWGVHALYLGLGLLMLRGRPSWRRGTARSVPGGAG